MHTEAPYEYIRDYYAHVHRKNEEDPEAAEFWLSKLARVEGDSGEFGLEPTHGGGRNC